MTMALGEDALAAALEAQSKDREIKAAAINKARKVDKAQFLGSDFDREFLLGKTFSGGSKAAADRR